LVAVDVRKTKAIIKIENWIETVNGFQSRDDGFCNASIKIS